MKPTDFTNAFCYIAAANEHPSTMVIQKWVCKTKLDQRWPTWMHISEQDF